MTKLAGNAVAAALALLILGAASAEGAVSARAQVRLKPDLTVAGSTIALGDLFENAGAAGATDVIAAPAPGEVLSINAASLVSLAHSHGLDWDNPDRLVTVDVTRASREFGADEITAILSGTLKARTGGRALEIKLMQQALSLSAPSDTDDVPEAKLLSFDERTGRFEAAISVAGGDSARVVGTAHEVMSVPVLARPFERGETVTEADLQWTEMRIDTMPRSAITDAGELVGLSLKRPMGSGQIVMTNDVERPVVVKKGALVTMTYEVPGMTLTDTGRALGNGAVGDSVQVLNERSHRTVTAIVVSADAVRLSPSAAPAVGPQASLQ